MSELRGTIKREHGFGWSVRDIHGKVQLTQRLEDGTRTSVTLDLSWDASCVTALLLLLQQIRGCMDAQQMGLREAYQLFRRADPAKPSRVNWDGLVASFQAHKTSHTGAVKPSTFNAAYAPVMRQVLEVMQSRPAPMNGRDLLAALRDRCGGAPGSRARKLRIQYAAQLLRYAVEQQGGPDRWLPPADLIPFIGKPLAEDGGHEATPIKDEQLIRLLAAIPDPRWRLAIGLLGCFGLRPVELRYCRVSGDKLQVEYQKRTARGMTKAGLVEGLDPQGLDGESRRLLNRLAAAEIPLPPLGAADGDAAQSVRQYLNRRPFWNVLRAEVAARGGKLASYSFRHGYALRAHELYGHSPRITAALMRHSLETHHRHYGAWTDGETLEVALERGRQHRAVICAGATAV
ncbi:hypothetical protein [Cyanobium sp. NS01]|uniref:hypothetical protein n=1 Tax=Cyanobium sp. NS01 TaxID=261284 RepID=UPI00164529F2|nr:hypothetical protein [Cyanobium sp. NS01]QNI72005.1 hypothetical protein CyaNS01_02911 [Cyanobium sp. NS01]